MWICQRLSRTYSNGMLGCARNIIIFFLAANALEGARIVVVAIKVKTAHIITLVVVLSTHPQMGLRNGLHVQQQTVAGVSEKIIMELLTHISTHPLEFRLPHRLRDHEQSVIEAKRVLEPEVTIVDHPLHHQSIARAEIYKSLFGHIFLQKFLNRVIAELARVSQISR